MIYIKCGMHLFTMECYSAIKKDILPFTIAWKNFKVIMLNKSDEGDRYCMVSLMLGI